jgi:hypothetical protein
MDKIPCVYVEMSMSLSVDIIRTGGSELQKKLVLDH